MEIPLKKPSWGKKTTEAVKISILWVIPSPFKGAFLPQVYFNKFLVLPSHRFLLPTFDFSTPSPDDFVVRGR